MLDLGLARRLREAGLAWNPLPGDRFVLPDRGMDDEVFVVSHMVVEIHDTPGGQVIGFNGTTEWALDSLEQRQVLWMPRETQLRELLGDRFVALESVTGGFAVTLQLGDDENTRTVREADSDAESAYARALLTVLASLSPGG
ncbi:pilus assembly protein CpaE [Kineosporia sp. J2-2]|uniref:Pilus assembly protein CpaE n=1 Tax=Kineosporia corallincola TaxID=2835133 RepID=A0ABS5TT05_9ACTN|nr:pilus assembly protein CpaE [Kineosporia corallincola]MBT0773918.1 pilus assembly protein CpaE [Kineosporia corallincola]